MKINFAALFFVIVTWSLSSAQSKWPSFYSDSSSKWADSLIKTMTDEEKIAQLFMVAAYSDEKKQNPAVIDKLILENKIGGLIFFQGGPYRQAVLTNRFQGLSRIPLLISIDAEWGLAMRLDSTISFPRQMTLGAIQNKQLIYDMGKEIARQCKRLGIHVNLAPVADINNNPLNPVIGMRSFGEDKKEVADRAMLYMKGMQDYGILANAKHFPGHGDTDSDSHKTLPTITASRKRLDTLELYPFKEMIAAGLGSMMVAHLYIPSIDAKENTASTLSPYVVNELLKKNLDFKGLIFTDALNMKGVSKFYDPGEVDAKALLAGNDVLLFAENVPKAIEEIKKLIASGDITIAEIEIRVKKLLMVKHWAGLSKYKPVDLKNLLSDLNTSGAKMLNRSLIESSITLLENKNNILPLQKLDTLKLAVVSLGNSKELAFKERLNNYTRVDFFGIDKDDSDQEFDALYKKLKNYNLIIVQLNNTSNNPGTFGLTASVKEFLFSVVKNKKSIVCIFGNPYMLPKIDFVKNSNALIMAYENYSDNQDLCAQMIFGGVQSSGKLPVSVSKNYLRNHGLTTVGNVRLKYTLPEDAGLDPLKLLEIDSIVNRAIKEKAFPGCQVWIAKEGKVVYQKSFGYHTYENANPVKNSDLYDLASITKIAATTPVFMRLYEQNKISLDERLCYYFPQLDTNNKANISFRELLTHQSGLVEWIPYWKKTLEKGIYIPHYYRNTFSDSFNLRVADNLYTRSVTRDSMLSMIFNSKLKEPGKYLYSDLGYYMLQDILEDKMKTPLNVYAEDNFYKPLGLRTMGYLPRFRFPLKEIAPTEYDALFRKQLIWGDVHDQGAAMLGGVAGHAGLFSNANDIGIFMQMLMQKGSYAGVRYFDSTTVNTFTACQYCVDNRRALGFDKPETSPDKSSPVCDCVSYLSFGHQGFTGTIAWADPDKKIVYIFLSNRIFPDANNKKITTMAIRTKIQRVVYSSIVK